LLQTDGEEKPMWYEKPVLVNVTLGEDVKLETVTGASTRPLKQYLEESLNTYTVKDFPSGRRSLIYLTKNQLSGLKLSLHGKCTFHKVVDVA
jgi:hypothetical protein